MKTMEIQHYPAFQALFTHLKINLYTHGFLKASPLWDHHHLEPCHRLYYITNESAYFCKYGDKEKIPLKKGHIYILPRHIRYHLRCDDKMEKVFFHFDLQLAPGVDLLDYFNNHLSIKFYDKALYELPALFKEVSLGSVLKSKAILWDTLSRFLAPYSDELLSYANMLKRYQVINQYLEKHCYFGVSVKDLADKMNVSTSYLSRIFKRDLGMTVKEMITTRLLVEVKKELIFTEKTIKEIASDFNFTDEFYFSHFIKKHTGFSPRTYRQLHHLYSKNQDSMILLPSKHAPVK